MRAKALSAPEISTRTIATFPFLTLGKSQAAFPADEEEMAPLEEFERE